MPSSVYHQQLRRRTAAVVCSMVLLASMWWASSPTTSATAANANVSVGVTVASATNISTAGCATGAAGITDFGQIVAGSGAMTSSDCAVQFGSSNNTSALRVRQSDAFGRAMFAYTNGAQDETFDGDSGTGDGYVFVNELNYGDLFAHSYAALATDGGLITTGHHDAVGDEVLLIKFLNDGRLDTLFDGASGIGNGRVGIVPFPGLPAIPGDIVSDLSGAYHTLSTNNTNGSVALTKFNDSGILDSSYDGASGVSNGNVVIPLGTNPAKMVLLAKNANGNHIGVGSVDDDIVLFSVNAQGVLDATFDGASGTGNGIVRIDAGGADVAAAAVMTSDGSVVVVGASGISPFVMRVDPNGMLDATFDGDSGIGNGVVPVTVTDFAVQEVVVNQNGRIMVVGYTTTSGYDTTLVRLLASGAIDTTFDGPTGSGNGVVVHQPFSGNSLAVAAIEQLDGKTILGGFGCCVSGGVAFTARILEDGNVDPTYGGSLFPGFAQHGPNGDWQNVSSFEQLDDGRIIGAGANYFAYARMFVVKLTSATVPDYNGGSASWSNAMFGVCLDSMSNATSAWAVGSPCTASNGPSWNDVPIAAENVAAANSGVTNATARFRFGFKSATAQTPGNYYAQVSFEVVAPG